jgi:outer membrane protein
MNKKPFQYLVSLYLLATSCCVLADDIETGTFDAAIQRAFANRPELNIERSKIQGAKTRVDEAKGMFFPTLNAFATDQHIKGYDDFSGVTANAQIGATNYLIAIAKTTPQYQLNYGVELNYNLYSGGRHIAQLREMSASEDAAHAQYDVLRKQILLDVTEQYWGFRKAQITLLMAKRSLDYAKEEMRVAVEQFKQGRIAKIELDAKTLAAEKQAVDARKATRTLLDYRRRYAFTLGVEAAKEEELQQFEPKDKAENINIEMLIPSLGLMKEPEIQKVQADLIGAQMRAKQSRSEYLPVIDLFARYTEVGRSDIGFVEAQANLGKDATFIGVKLTWNLFDGFKSDSRITRATAESEQFRFQVEKSQRDFNHNKQEMQADEEDVSDQLQLASKQLEFTQSQVAIARKRLDVGQHSSLEFHATQLALDNARSTVDKLKIDTLIQRIKKGLY